MPIDPESGLQQAPINLLLDPHDVVVALDNNDDRIVLFIVQMLAKNDSSEVREQLAERLKDWAEDH